MIQRMTCQLCAHFNCIHSGPEDWVIVLDTPPEFGPARTRQVTAILFQDTEGFDQPTQGHQNLWGRI